MRDPRSVALRHAEAYRAASVVNGRPEAAALVDIGVKVFEKTLDLVRNLGLGLTVDMANELHPKRRRLRDPLKPVHRSLSPSAAICHS
ncbi:hypothetical protein MPC4_70099 [Methylocella tundrae]|uniref:Uncharacterized protein n=1 Tax=Methylocella tundrae TaxID=227605 RepID=A0A8B6MBW5_METTU|nr:hypothetical protein MPC1_4880001 [Methylocella tundrae]VTZ52211.1 hypothetical protein MPC4_70099 [Methylocella tundrae]